jgi:hypothetical protein
LVTALDVEVQMRWTTANANGQLSAYYNVVSPGSRRDLAVACAVAVHVYEVMSTTASSFDVPHLQAKGRQMKALACAAMLALATPFVFAQDKAATKMQPLAAAGETVKVSAKVIAVDQTDRLVGVCYCPMAVKP